MDPTPYPANPAEEENEDAVAERPETLLAELAQLERLQRMGYGETGG